MNHEQAKNKKILLRGEGSNQHTLYGDFRTEDTLQDFGEVRVYGKSLLRHEQPGGAFGEHFGLTVEQGNWVMGKQVEYNPFKREVTRIWD